MVDAQTFTAFLYGWTALALVLLPIQLFLTPPYGRHRSTAWGPVMDNRAGWVVMELVSPIAFAWCFVTGGGVGGVAWIFFALWMAHYIHRSLVFPMRMRTSGKTIPVAIVASAIGFNGINGWSNGYYLGGLGGPYPEDWLADPRFIIGMLLFCAGAALNISSDNILLRLREPGGGGYKIPRGGLFALVSCPNHLGEIVEWAGFAIMCWNLPALAFAVWTAANLIPRSISHHRWYRERFADYPRERRAIIPGIL